MFADRKHVEKIKNSYPEGTRIELIQMNEEPYPVPSGTQGTVSFVDDIGQIHVNWDNGSTLALVVGIDSFKLID